MGERGDSCCRNTPQSQGTSWPRARTRVRKPKERMCTAGQGRCHRLIAMAVLNLFEGCPLTFLYSQSTLGMGLICEQLSPFAPFFFTSLGAPAEWAGHRCGHSASTCLMSQFYWDGHGAFAGAGIFSWPFSGRCSQAQTNPSVLDPKRDASPIGASQHWTWPPRKDPCCSSSSSEHVFTAESWTLENPGSWQRVKQVISLSRMSCNVAAPATHIPTCKMSPGSPEELKSKYIFDREVLITSPSVCLWGQKCFINWKHRWLHFWSRLFMCLLPCFSEQWLFLGSGTPAGFASVWSSFPSSLQVFSTSSSALLCPRPGRRAAGKTRDARAQVSFIVPTCWEGVPDSRGPIRERWGWWWEFYCLEASDPDLPSTSPNLD